MEKNKAEDRSGFTIQAMDGDKTVVSGPSWPFQGLPCRTTFWKLVESRVPCGVVPGPERGERQEARNPLGPASGRFCSEIPGQQGLLRRDSGVRV